MTPGDGSDLPILGDEDDGDWTEAPRVVLITGASGNIGRKLREAWSNRYDLILIDRRPDPANPDVLVADLNVWDESWTALFDEADVVVHLAANADEHASWEDLVEPNLDALTNVLLAAAQAGIDRFVFAGSNHAMGGHRAPGCAGPITPTSAPRPGNAYGATKLVGERLGRGFAAAYGMTFIGLRIGWVQPGANRPETLDPATGDVSIWLSNRDLVSLFTAAIEAELAEGSWVVVNGLSRNEGTRWTLDEAARTLGYIPEDGLTT